MQNFISFQWHIGFWLPYSIDTFICVWIHYWFTLCHYAKLTAKIASSFIKDCSSLSRGARSLVSLDSTRNPWNRKKQHQQTITLLQRDPIKGLYSLFLEKSFVTLIQKSHKITFWKTLKEIFYF